MFLSSQVTEEDYHSDVWLLDNVYINHMTSNELLFSRLDFSVNTKIKLGNNYLVPALKEKTLFMFLLKIMRRSLYMMYSMFQI